jgi:uncharacterized protein (DUF2235 family)
MSREDARRLVLCLDGTWNSSFAEHKRYEQHRTADGEEHTVLKPTNPLKICRAVKPLADDGRMQICYYDIGVGALARYSGGANTLLYQSDRLLGGAWGAGFEGNVEDALHFLALNYRAGDEVFIFGFSRGAAEARAVTMFIDWCGGLPAKSDAYYLPILFREYVKGRGRAFERNTSMDSINTERHQQKPPRGDLQPQKIDVAYLGVFDTVLAIGSRFEATEKSTTAEERSFFTGDMPAACVRNARQALAVDEHRWDFRPEIWKACRPGQTMEQRWFAGVHSNVGGGYGRDGLANVALRWIVEGVEKQLDLDGDYLHYYFSANHCGSFGSLYNSSTAGFRIGDAIRRGDGTRKLTGWPDSANLQLDATVIERMNRSEADLKNGADEDAITTLYRPRNVIEFLASFSDAEREKYLQAIQAPPLPDDVKRAIAALRR